LIQTTRRIKGEICRRYCWSANSQRLRDPVDGTVCYLYLPISTPHSPTTATGFVQYGPNTIGSINCMSAPPEPAPRKK
jgi:hypothetical protein